MLWAEADRMRGLEITQDNLTNQQGVVKNEVKVNVLNQPYGGFPWLDLPQHANTNWYNAHNFYGDLEHLDAATLDDVRQFFKTYYAPNNAVLVVDRRLRLRADESDDRALLRAIPRGPAPSCRPSPSRGRRRRKCKSRTTRWHRSPRYAVAYHVPDADTPEYYAMGLIDQILAQGQDSRLYQKLVRDTGITSSMQAGINVGLGNMYNYRGPMLWTVGFIHDPAKSRAEITTAVDSVIEDIRTKPVSAGELERARTKIRSNLYNLADPSTRFGLIDLLAVGAMWEDDPRWASRLEAGFAKVTPQLIQATAREYLRPANRSILLVQPAPAAAAAPATGAKQ